MYREEDYLNLSGIQHFVFCRRQWALIHIEQQWEENLLTVNKLVYSTEFDCMVDYISFYKAIAAQKI